jgi:apocytochrome f
MRTRSFTDAWLQGTHALKRTAAIALATMVVLLVSSLSLPQAANAYPFFAQQGFENPREPTGRIVCANCHLAQKPTDVELPQSVLPDTVFEAVVKVPYDTSVQQVVAGGAKAPLNVGAVLILPKGYKLAPEDRIPEEMKEKVQDLYFQPYSEDKENIIVIGPLPGEQYQEIVFPILSPDPGTDKSIHFGKGSVHVGGNRGRGQVYPTGEKSNNAVFNASVTGVITKIAKTEDENYEVTIQKADGSTTVDAVPAGPEMIVTEGQEIKAGDALTNNPNVGGFGQADKEIVLQDPNRIVGLLAFFAIVVLAQIMLVLKKKQVEKVQAAEMEF